MRALLDTKAILDVLLTHEPHAEASAIVTRDQAGFKRATLPVVAPSEFLITLRQRRALPQHRQR